MVRDANAVRDIQTEVDTGDVLAFDFEWPA